MKTTQIVNYFSNCKNQRVVYVYLFPQHVLNLTSIDLTRGLIQYEGERYHRDTSIFRIVRTKV